MSYSLIYSHFSTTDYNNWFIFPLENNIPKCRMTECKDIISVSQSHCVLWITMAEYHACCLSTMGFIWLSEAWWVRHTRPDHEEVTLLPASSPDLFWTKDGCSAWKTEYDSCRYIYFSIQSCLIALLFYCTWQREKCQWQADNLV